ncbi:MAG: DUF4004 family protein [Oscillospiraceae bacterium]|nr:DUF4004 family protein [Oscillospiraceae bacterium]
MEQALISKKELLQRYGISYGALYRWKRKGLIPEDWFIKKSAVTGQETFFPEELICQRIELIQSQKDDIPLDDLAKQFREEAPRQSLILKTVFGERSFLTHEIQSIYFENSKGERKDILQQVLQLCRQEQD